MKKTAFLATLIAISGATIPAQAMFSRLGQTLGTVYKHKAPIMIAGAVLGVHAAGIGSSAYFTKKIITQKRLNLRIEQAKKSLERKKCSHEIAELIYMLNEDPENYKGLNPYYHYWENPELRQAFEKCEKIMSPKEIFDNNFDYAISRYFLCYDTKKQGDKEDKRRAWAWRETARGLRNKRENLIKNQRDPSRPLFTINRWR